MKFRIHTAGIIARKDLAGLAMLFISYFLFSAIGIYLPESRDIFGVIWPAAGISLAALLLNPRRLWPVLLLTVFSSGVLANIIAGKPPAAIIGFMTVNTTESLLCALLITKMCGGPVSFRRVCEVLWLFAAAVFANGFTALGGALIVNVVYGGAFFDTWISWIISDGFGIIIVTPLIVGLYHYMTASKRMDGILHLKAFAALAATGIISYMVFNSPLAISDEISKPYVLFPVIIWLAFSFRVPGVTIGLGIMSVIAVIGNHNVSGWTHDDPLVTLKQIEVLISVYCFTGLLAAAAVEERMTAERQVSVKNSELEEKNAELERFTYTVSHDLKNPLITITGFSGVLKKHAEQGDKEQIKKDADFIIDATSNMSRLLNELLEISRLGRIPNKTEEILFGDIVEDAMNITSGEITNKGAEVTMQEGLKDRTKKGVLIMADRHRMAEVMQNLISNAVKFNAKGSKPLVEVGMKNGYRNHDTVYFVKDNGVGIESRYLTKIFELFERLDTGQEGTGVGLAIVKRIIEIHGGEIWAESGGPGKGSVFYFTLGGA